MDMKFIVNRLDERKIHYVSCHSITLPLSGSGSGSGSGSKKDGELDGELCFNNIYDDRLNPLFRYSHGGECGGLLLLECFRGRMIICNPTTKETRFLPRSHIPQIQREERFEDRGSDRDRVGFLVASGLGYDSNSQDFKIVRLFQFFDDEPPATGEIYSFKEDCWKTLPAPLPQWGGFVTVAVYVNGFLYWMVAGACLHSFNLATEEFSDQGDLPVCRNFFGDRQLFDLDGKLACFLYDYPDVDDLTGNYLKAIEIWLWIEGSCTWEQHRCIEYPFNDVMKPLALKDDILFLEVNRLTDGLCWLRLYDLKTGKFEDMDVSGYMDKMEIFPYTPSKLIPYTPSALRLPKPTPDDYVNGCSVPHVGASDSVPHVDKKPRID